MFFLALGMKVDRAAEIERVRAMIRDLPEGWKEVLADLLPGSGYDANTIALRFGVDPKSVNTFQRRIERKLGVRFPRPDRVGRPVKD